MIATDDQSSEPLPRGRFPAAFFAIVALIVLIAVVGMGLWQIEVDHRKRPALIVRNPRAVMGTSCTLAVVVAPSAEPAADAALSRAEEKIRGVESRMSTWLADSELSRLNSADAQEAYRNTDGAFDVTCRPLIELWREAGKSGKLPTDEHIAQARAASHWDAIQINDSGAVKSTATARVDLGGIAKGWAILSASRFLTKHGYGNHLIDIGGDMHCQGEKAGGEPWPVDMKHPFEAGVMAQLHAFNAAVCTSGDYARFVEIGGRRYSHIIDPRSGRPAAGVASVTVVAGDAITADVWTTALSVLGEAGISRLPAEAEAMLVVGSAEDHRVVYTPGFAEMLVEVPPGWQVIER